MKGAILILLLLFGLGRAVAQDNYFVTVVKGVVTKPDGTKIKSGAKIQLTDKLLFGTKESQLILLHPVKGRFIVFPGKASATKDNSIAIMVKDYFQLHAQNVRLSSRSIDDELLSLGDRFKTDPSINSKLLIIDTLKTRLSGPEFRGVDNEENFFFLQLAADKPINHKLTVVNNSLQITKDDIMFYDKLYERSDGQLNLGFVQDYSTNKKMKLVGVIEPEYLSSEACSDIMKSIKASMHDKPEREILKEIYTELYYIYGKPDVQTIEQLYQKLK